VIVAGAPSNDDDLVVVVASDGKEGRAIVIDGIPVDNAAHGEAGFKLLKPADLDNENGDKVSTVYSPPFRTKLFFFSSLKASLQISWRDSIARPKKTFILNCFIQKNRQIIFDIHGHNI
jgi:hypothetical protein